MTYQNFLNKKGEKKWQDYWEQKKLFRAKDFDRRPKYYVLIEFPYPSSEGLHVGTPRSYTALDIIARKRRLEGFNVLYPIGFDAFGLPAENYAIKTGTHPKITTEKNIKNFRRQLKAIGLSFDWSREITTTDPGYYKWTQWIFLQLFKKGLAYKAEMPINFCLDCKVGLANEEVVGGQCDRCSGQVVKKVKKQWLLKITDYAERLEKDLETVDYWQKIKLQQKNWIGRSEGAKIKFEILNSKFEIEVYSTRPDTLFGVTYMVLSPEHPLIGKLKDQIENVKAVEKYLKEAAKKSDLEAVRLAKAKTGVELKGIKAINPAGGKEIPIWVADYVVISYGTGAIMAVPGHDQRDWEFAQKFKLPIIEVIGGGNIKKAAYTDNQQGELVNSDFINGLNPKEAIKKMISWLAKEGHGKKAVNYKLRDWVFSRQRYWGEPIPIIECDKCGFVPLAEKDLPLKLPEIKKFQAGKDGESPLAKLKDWVNVKCPKCGGEARRETDTMPQWAGSSWYFLRYLDPKNNSSLADTKKLKYWLKSSGQENADGVDWYNGGMEHTTLHLLYSRFWYKFLYDLKVVPTGEPYAKRTSHGMILGEGGDKMSKSRGNVVNPDEVIKKYGADTFRVYEMFMGPYDQAIPWSTQGVVGVRRFLDRIWNFYDHQKADRTTALSPALEIRLHQTIKKVTEDIEEMKFNTAVSALMILFNQMNEAKTVSNKCSEKFLILLSLFAPHIAEELWQQTGHRKSIAQEKWPAYDKSKIKDETVEFVVQINGKVRAKLKLSPEISQTKAVAAAQQDKNVQKYLKGAKIKKTVFVKGRLISLVV